MRIFVTGALGFIGAHFVERALAAGHLVTGLYRSARGEKGELLRKVSAQGARLEQRDLFEPERYASLLRDVDCVCHFAAAFKGSGQTDEDFNRTNILGTERVLLAAAQAGVRRFVLCSTAGIYGQNLPGLTDENAPARPWNAYERSKHGAEERLRELAGQYGMEYVILRPAVVYGPRDDRLLKLFSSAAKGRFPLFGAGAGRRHMVFVTDVADAFILGCTTAAAANQDMIIAGPEAVPLRELLDVLAAVVQRKRCGPKLPLTPMLLLAAIIEDGCKLIDVSPPLYRRRMDFYRSDAAFDCTRAHRVMGWLPRVTLSDGLRRTYEAIRTPPKLVTQIASYALVALSILLDASLPITPIA